MDQWTKCGVTRVGRDGPRRQILRQRLDGAVDVLRHQFLDDADGFLNLRLELIRRDVTVPFLLEMLVPSLVVVDKDELGDCPEVVEEHGEVKPQRTRGQSRSLCTHTHARARAGIIFARRKASQTL